MDTQALLDSLDLGVVVIAPDWTIAQWSAAASRITGLAADRVLGRNFWVAFPTTKGTHVDQVLQDVLADGQPQTILAPARPPGARFDALLLDVHLDDEHTGFDLFEQLQLAGRGQERRIVFTTGDSISPHTRDALQRSDRPVLRKPFSLEELREMLERVAGG